MNTRYRTDLESTKAGGGSGVAEEIRGPMDSRGMVSGQRAFATEPSPTGLYDAEGRPVRLIVEERTATGTVRRLAPFIPQTRGVRYYEYISDATWCGVPLVHIGSGRNPETGKWVLARGVVAIGQFAVGVVSIGQMAVGVLSVGQLSIGGLAALGQLAVGSWAIGQLAAGVQAAIGMLAVGLKAIGFAAMPLG